jgi:hypothetical protein
MVEGAVPVGEAVECRGRRGGSRGRCMELVVEDQGRWAEEATAAGAEEDGERL